MVSATTLLQHLPPFRDRELLIENDQVVHDIIKEVVKSHKIFASDYDSISKFFPNPGPGGSETLLKYLFEFCERNIDYKIETVEDQTTRSPAAILTIASGDCKHYAGFIAGILDAKCRDGYKINWCYRFASYDLFDSSPGHVFVVVKEKGKEFWIDPVLESFNERLIPSYIVDKKANVMLKRISGLEITDSPQDYRVTEFLNNTDADTQAYNDVQTMVKYGLMNTDLSMNDDLLPALREMLPANEFSKIENARGSIERMAISGLGDSIAHAVAKVTLAVPRAAYLSLVGLNVFGLATKLFNCIYKDESGINYYQPGQDEIYKKWYKLGGDWDPLLNTVKHGKKNKAILGAAPVAVPVWITAATAIIAALGGVISSVLKSKQQQTGVNYDIDPATGLPYGSNSGGPFADGSGQGQGADLMSFLQKNILLIGGGIALFLILKKRRA